MVEKRAESTAAVISFVVVFPTLPVTPTTRTGILLRYQAERASRAFRVSSTSRVLPSG